MTETFVKNTIKQSECESIEKPSPTSHQDSTQATNPTGTAAKTPAERKQDTGLAGATTSASKETVKHEATVTTESQLNDGGQVMNDSTNVKHDESQQGPNVKFKELLQNEQNAIECITKGIDAGKYLKAIRDDGLYVLRINPKTQRPFTWEDYCNDVLKVSIQYVDRKILAWITREKIKPQIDKKFFDELPLTISMWVELHKRAEGERIKVLKGLITEFDEEGKSLGSLKARDIRDFQIHAVHNDFSEEDNEDDDEGIEETDEVAIDSDEPMDIVQMADDVRHGKTTDISRLSPVNRKELRTKLEAMLEESREVQNNIETFLKELETDTDQSSEQGIEEGAGQVA